ncbi:hypothetical protein, partial [Nonomuraea sp. NPDC003754]
RDVGREPREDPKETRDVGREPREDPKETRDVAKESRESSKESRELFQEPKETPKDQRDDDRASRTANPRETTPPEPQPKRDPAPPDPTPRSETPRDTTPADPPGNDQPHPPARAHEPNNDDTARRPEQPKDETPSRPDQPRDDSTRSGHPDTTRPDQPRDDSATSDRPKDGPEQPQPRADDPKDGSEQPQPRADDPKDGSEQPQPRADDPKDGGRDSRHDRVTDPGRSGQDVLDTPGKDHPDDVDQTDPGKPQVVEVDGVKVLQIPLDPPTAREVADLLEHADAVQPADLPAVEGATDSAGAPEGTAGRTGSSDATGATHATWANDGSDVVSAQARPPSDGAVKSLVDNASTITPKEMPGVQLPTGEWGRPAVPEHFRPDGPTGSVDPGGPVPQGQDSTGQPPADARAANGQISGAAHDAAPRHAEGRPEPGPQVSEPPPAGGPRPAEGTTGAVHGAPAAYAEDPSPTGPVGDGVARWANDGSDVVSMDAKPPSAAALEALMDNASDIEPMEMPGVHVPPGEWGTGVWVPESIQPDGPAGAVEPAGPAPHAQDPGGRPSAAAEGGNGQPSSHTGDPRPATGAGPTAASTSPTTTGASSMAAGADAVLDGDGPGKWANDGSDVVSVDAKPPSAAALEALMDNASDIEPMEMPGVHVPPGEWGKGVWVADDVGPDGEPGRVEPNAPGRPIVPPGS